MNQILDRQDRGKRSISSNVFIDKWHFCESWEKDEGVFAFIKQDDLYSWNTFLSLYLSEQLFPRFLENGYCRTTIDAGANYGALTYPFAIISENVHAFEMRKDVIECNKLNTKHFGNVQYHNVALSDTKKDIVIFMDTRSGLSCIWDDKMKQPDQPLFNYIHDREKNHYKDFKDYDESEITFKHDKSNTIDEYDLKNVDFFKLDVQFQEEEVLRGAINTLKRNTPLIIAEHPGGRNFRYMQQRNSYKNFLIDLNYYPYELWGRTDVIYVHQKHLDYYRSRSKL